MPGIKDVLSTHNTDVIMFHDYFMKQYSRHVRNR